jgi:hypothetical protein
MRLLGRMYGVIPQLQQAAEPFALIFPPHGLAVIVLGMAIAMIPLPEAMRRLEGVKDSIRLDTVRWASGVLLFVMSLASILASGSSSFLYFRF